MSLFQTFDEKDQCLLVYRDGKFSNSITPSCTKTWSYSAFLENESDIEYAQLYTGGASLKSFCNSQNLKDLEDIEKRIKAILRSSFEVGLNLDEYCMYEMIPRHYLTKLAKIRNRACKKIFETYSKPKNYNHLLNLNKLIVDIKYKPLTLNLSGFPRITEQDKSTYKNIVDSSKKIDYDMFKAVTGRLTNAPKSFTVMTLAKKYRNIVVPENKWLFELDFNAHELRIALALLGHDQPKEDLHDWNLNNVFVKLKDREKAKKRMFSWLYNPNAEDKVVERIYDREKLKKEYFDGEQITNPFGRVIKSNEYHAVNYLIQSTAADVVFEQAYKVFQFLKGKKSFIKFLNQDSIVIDLHPDEQYSFNEIKNLYADTRFGTFKINCSGGTNWGEMKKLLIH